MSSQVLTTGLMQQTYTNAIIYSACTLGLIFAAFTTNQILKYKMDPSLVKVQKLSAEELQKIKENGMPEVNADEEGLEPSGPPQTPEACFQLMERIAKII